MACHLYRHHRYRYRPFLAKTIQSMARSSFYTVCSYEPYNCWCVSRRHLQLIKQRQEWPRYRLVKQGLTLKSGYNMCWMHSCACCFIMKMKMMRKWRVYGPKVVIVSSGASWLRQGQCSKYTASMLVSPIHEICHAWPRYIDISVIDS